MMKTPKPAVRRPCVHAQAPRFGHSQLVALAACLTALILPACADPLEFADWSLEVPAGTRIFEYPIVPIEERTEHIDLVEDLVIGQRGDDPDYIFYRPNLRARCRQQPCPGVRRRRRVPPNPRRGRPGAKRAVTAVRDRNRR